MAYNPHYQEIVNEQENALDISRRECIRKYGQKLDSNEPIFNETTRSWMCPPFFDSLMCWPPQSANTTAAEPCPIYLVGFIPTRNATRHCTESGRWFSREGNSTFTNFSGCFNAKVTTVYKNVSHNDNFKAFQEAVHLIKILSETGYAVSLISLIIAFTIMFKIKKLHCARNILHMNLFASFILRSLIYIIKYALFEEGLALPKDIVERNGLSFFHTDVTDDNNFECKLIVSLAHYFAAANYSWILMEGIYLNNLILRALFTDSNKSLVYYISFGWGLPLLIVIPWVVARILLEDTLCWTMNENSGVFLIIMIPTLASVVINLVLFVIISVVLYNKLKSPINEDSRRYLKWAKSTLVLVPLFGVHYTLYFILFYSNDTITWMIIDRLCGSFQGFFVAILYCFLNGEVKSELKPHFKSLLLFLATNNVTKCCFPRREKFLSSAAGRQSVCTTMSCSSLYNNGVSQRNSKTKFDQLSKVKLTNLHAEHQKEVSVPNGVRHSLPKTGHNGHFAPNLTFVHGRYPMSMTTNLDVSMANDMKLHYSQNLPVCEEEVSMLGGENHIINNLELSYEK